MIVMKFGGSSLESAPAIERVVSIVESFRGYTPVVVVSAMGKTTDRLLKIGNLAAEGKTGAARAELQGLAEFHSEHAKSGEIALLTASAAAIVEQIATAHTLSPMNSDALLSHGERLSSVVVTAALQSAGISALHLCAEKLIVTDQCHTRASPLHWESYAKLRRAIPNERSRQVAVMGGFIGSTEDGVPTTLGRGGSDFTAALVGAAINAEEVQIWTDVNGMLSCDPRVIPDGRCLRHISYTEATEMAEWGAEVLHPATVAPAMRQRVPVSIRNSRNADHPGTRIENAQPCRYEGLVKSIACLKNITLLRIFPTTRVLTPQFRALVKSIFLVHQTDFRAVNGRNVIEAAVSESASLPGLIQELSGLGKVEVESGLAAISLIGKGIDENHSLVSHAVKTLSGRSVPFHALGTASMRVTFLVAAQELYIATESLHNEFVKFQENGPFYREFEALRIRQKQPTFVSAQSPIFC